MEIIKSFRDQMSSPWWNSVELMSLLRTSWEKVLPAITPLIPETEDQLETWAKSPVDPLTKAREKSVFFFNKTDEAKRVIEEDRQRQNYQGYSIIGGQFSITNVSVFRNDARNVIDNHLKTLKASWIYVW